MTAARKPLRILAIDIGGSHLKAALIDARGRMLTDKLTVKTPAHCAPHTMIATLVKLVATLPPHDLLAVGFPGVVRGNHVVTAPHWNTKKWANFELANNLSRRLNGAPARLINDAEMQGLAVISGRGLELMLTLGTGAGTGLFSNGKVMPHLELAQHPVHKNKTYNDYIGDAARRKAGKKHWNKRVARVLNILYSLLHYDRILIGGGNAAHIAMRLPKNATLVSNDAGLEGGAKLWSDVIHRQQRRPSLRH
jgi:polyphosphate glucokinase